MKKILEKIKKRAIAFIDKYDYFVIGIIAIGGFLIAVFVTNGIAFLIDYLSK